MKLNRDLQLEILRTVTDAFPTSLYADQLDEISATYGEIEMQGNMLYLAMHGLLQLKYDRVMSGDIVIHTVTPTEKAFDFLADDGGLSAVLGVVTVKFHADTIKDLIAMRIESADIPQAEKHTLLKALKELPSEALKHLTTRLVDSAFENLPATIPLLGKFFGL